MINLMRNISISRGLALLNPYKTVLTLTTFGVSCQWLSPTFLKIS